MRVARSITILASLFALSAIPVAAQDFDPEATPPPRTIPRAKLSAVMNGWDDPSINGAVRDSVRSANEAIEGRRRIRFTTTMPERAIGSATLEAGNDELDIVVVSGGSSANTITAARRFQETRYIDIGGTSPCVTQDGIPDPSGTCAGGEGSLPFNYTAIDFAEDEGAYLAGIIAAGASPRGRIGVIGGTPSCGVCNRYIQGFELGARSVAPDITIVRSFLSDDDAAIAFGDPETARLYTQAFVDVHEIEVLFPVARGNTDAMLDVACEAGVRIVGADVDLTATRPAVADCVLTSVVKPYGDAVSDAIFDIANGTQVRVKPYDIVNGGIVVTQEWQQVPGLPVDLPTQLQAAFDGIAAGAIVTCPEHCGRPAPDTVAGGAAAGTDLGSEGSNDG